MPSGWGGARTRPSAVGAVKRLCFWKGFLAAQEPPGMGLTDHVQATDDGLPDGRLVATFGLHAASEGRWQVSFHPKA